MNNRVLFARIGRMNFYDGPQPDDERPIAGGKWNENNIGHEVYNFRNVDGYCRGYAEPSGKSKKINLERIARDANGESLTGVLVVFVAYHPKQGGQVVVGWYRDAEVYRMRQVANLTDITTYDYYFKTRCENAVLLPTNGRTWKIPQHPKTFGQSQICYTLDVHGEDKGLAWQHDIVQTIREYEGENLFVNPFVEEEGTIGLATGGQGYGLTMEQRRVVENHAMIIAEEHFTLLHYHIENTHKNKPYDLVCSKDDERLFVEVKGTTGGSDRVFLTKNEVQHAQTHSADSVLFLLHGIELDRQNTTASGGEKRVLHPWQLADDDLTPL